MRHDVRMVGVAGLVAVTAVVVAACSGGSSPAARPPSSTVASTAASTSTSPSPAPSGPVTTGRNVRPGEKPPVMPPEAKQHTQEGALAFATYFVDALDWSIATTDPHLLVPISLPSCNTCNSYISDLTKLRAEGGRIQGGRIGITAARINLTTSHPGVEYIVSITTTQQPDVVIKPSARPSTESSTAQKIESNLLLVWRNTWLAFSVEAQ